MKELQEMKKELLRACNILLSIDWVGSGAKAKIEDATDILLIQINILKQMEDKL